MTTTQSTPAFDHSVQQPAAPEISTTAWSLPPRFATRNPPPWLREVFTKLQDLLSLEENWDSYGAAPIDQAAITNALLLVYYLASFVGVDGPSIGATPDGLPGLSWDNGHISLDVDVDASGRFSYVLGDYDDPTQDHEDTTEDPRHLLALLTAW